MYQNFILIISNKKIKIPLPNFDENDDITQSSSSILNVNVRINDHNLNEMYREMVQRTVQISI
ncbi:hypothetical protein BpHYR1_015902 [Brachionus plicatilis]|uniref:Uncharacterized protein n=1 Tax=Brachionus plicatilis TaxID=10195 RepID=A0A3M7RTA2_BRAPC|nr:hypothetical protein BpHYR1_015902 [Brachionus plicatilis]